MAISKHSSFLAASLMLAAFLLASAPQVQGGAVFEIREIVPDNADAYKFVFNQVNAAVPANLGSIVQSRGEGAGQVFSTSALPLTIFTLNKCVAVAPHIHPNAAETIFVLKGKIRISQFRGEEDGNNVRVTEVEAGSAGYIQQGSIHLVENLAKGTTQFLQIFDHVQGGANFVAPALVALPRNVVNSAFSAPVLPKHVTAKGPLVLVEGCY